MSNGFHTLLSFSTGETYYSTGVYTSAMLFEMFLFGLYVALFGSCLHIFFRNRRSLQKPILTAIVLMFMLATADIVWGILNMHLYILHSEPDSDFSDLIEDDDDETEIPIKVLQYKFLLYITSNIIADSLLIYRCYTLWNNSIRVIVLPCFVLLGGTACGYAFVGLSDDEYPFRFLLSIFLFSTLALNSVVTSLMAGRIWWIARQTRSILGPRLMKRYRTAIAIFIESGLVYSVYVILDVVLHILLLDAGLVQMVGLVPTLMIVQIGVSRAHTNTTMATTNNLTTYKDETETTSIGNFDSRQFTEYIYADPESQRIQSHHTGTMSAAAAPPLVIPAPPYRVDSVERYRVGYPTSPASDETRVAESP
ncbi:hypothetical protein P691DRAFT_809354 [Macrolepiota fuliginosa MF-IS2]|uniref:Uncharacterized protein n=1 Tax=Macrolepiota fuliginosa MF-IS2 TaxID=1400762 RepID=A0A9P6C3L4_9AGAR|nr:hypothetical protein P691DRAFT_809354 [Macrolepiota fuliginosa MF-IS2]